MDCVREAVSVAVSDAVTEIVGVLLGDARKLRDTVGVGVIVGVTVTVIVEESDTVGDGDREAVDVDDGKSSAEPINTMVTGAALGLAVAEASAVELAAVVEELVLVVVFTVAVTAVALYTAGGAGSAAFTTSIFIACTE